MLLPAGLAVLAVGALWWSDPGKWRVPLCGFHAMTGLYCPGCGALRATHALLHGRVLEALSQNALWVLAVPLVGYLAASRTRQRLGGGRLPGDVFDRRWFLISAVAAAIVFALLRNLPFGPLVMLAPN